MKNPAMEFSFILGLVSIILILISGPGTRFGLYPFTVGLLLMGIGSLMGLATIIIAIIRLSSGAQNMTLAVAGLVLGILSFGFLVITIWGGKDAPPIHDISTDTLDPPKFVSVLPLRTKALNPPEYGGAEIAKKQTAAFPDIKTIHLKLSPGEAFDKASKSVKALKWIMVDENRGDGRIEATDMTFFFGFKDDVVIRIRPEAGGSITDIRSESRVGGGDMGTNAKRIRKFIKLMNM